MIGEVHDVVPSDKLYEINGLQFLPFNTIYQLAAARHGPLWDRAAHAVLLPDLITDSSCSLPSSPTEVGGPLLKLAARASRFLRNVSGLWLLQECLREWQGCGLDDPAWIPPGDMPARIAQNQLLCQLTADATGVPVLAGPVEATALGNVLVQARAAGCLPSSLEAIRERVAATTPLRRYEPS